MKGGFCAGRAIERGWMGRRRAALRVGERFFFGCRRTGHPNKTPGSHLQEAVEETTPPPACSTHDGEPNGSQPPPFEALRV